MRHFDEIIGLAVARYGGPDAFERILAETRPPKPHDIAAIPDDRVLAAMARRVFCAGFSSKVINAKGRKQKFPAKGKAGSQLSMVAGEGNPPTVDSSACGGLNRRIAEGSGIIYQNINVLAEKAAAPTLP